MSKKSGSIFFKNLVFIFVIFLISVSLMRLQNSNINNISNILSKRVLFENLELIKNEIYFNKVYKYIENEVYIDRFQLESQRYSEISEIFENQNKANEDYFNLTYDQNYKVINIRYFEDGKLRYEEEVFIDVWNREV